MHQEALDGNTSRRVIYHDLGTIGGWIGHGHFAIWRAGGKKPDEGMNTLDHRLLTAHAALLQMLKALPVWRSHSFVKIFL